MLSREEENETEVRREDQDHINRFGRLNARLYEVKDDCSDIKKQLERLEDASTELLMADNNERCLLFLGDAFFESSEEEATQYCEDKVERLQEKIDDLETEETQILEEQTELKKILYDRFGKSINLEEK